MKVNLGSPQEYSRCDFAFHQTVAEAAHNRLAYQVLESLQHILRIWIVEVIVGREDLTESFRYHAATYEAIRARDPEGARKLVEVAMQRGGARLLAMMARAAAAPAVAAPAVAAPAVAAPAVQRA